MYLHQHQFFLDLHLILEKIFLVKEKLDSRDPVLYNNGKWADYNYYKIILANENTGGFLGVESVSSLRDSKGSETTRGLRKIIKSEWLCPSVQHIVGRLKIIGSKALCGRQYFIPISSQSRIQMSPE